MGTPEAPNYRWYPTVVTLGDEPGRVLVVDGYLDEFPNGGSVPGYMEIYSESTDTFSRVWGPGGPGGPCGPSGN